MADQKRLFFGMEVEAPWPATLPKGRILLPHHRHLTLAFLGQTDYVKIEKILSTCPRPPFKIGIVALFDSALFLPARHPRVAAWHLHCLEEASTLATYYKSLIHWLQIGGFPVNVREPFLPHVTLCRSPFNKTQWEKHFKPLPAFISHLHLYESLGNLHYHSLWSYPVIPPFKEREHTADLAFIIYGTSYPQLLMHASMALAFHFPDLITFVLPTTKINDLEDVIIRLNEIVTLADQKIGTPFKAISFHSQCAIHEELIEWEMIVDV